MSRRAPFTALLSAYAVSLMGTQVSAIAIPWLVLTTTGSAVKTGVVGFATMAPYVAAQVLTGPLVDRFGLRRSFVWGNLAAGVLVGLVPLVYLDAPPRLRPGTRTGRRPGLTPVHARSMPGVRRAGATGSASPFRPTGRTTDIGSLLHRCLPHPEQGEERRCKQRGCGAGW